MKLKTFIERLIVWMISVITCIPLIVGILIPMIVLIPLAYISWEIFSLGGGGIWYDVWIAISIYNPIRFFFVIIMELLIFFLGTILFVLGLYYLVKGKRNNLRIIQTGPYKLIRHPQNLGILLIALPFALYIPGFKDLGIRIGEILSWTLFSFILITYSLIEEYKLNKRFPGEFQRYRQRVGFFFPKMKFRRNKKEIFTDYRIKFLFLTLGYLTLFFLIYVLTNFFMNIGMFTVYL